MRLSYRQYPSVSAPAFVPTAAVAPDYFEAVFPDRAPRPKPRQAAGFVDAFPTQAIANVATFETAVTAPSYNRRRAWWRQSHIAEVAADPESFVPREWSARFPDRLIRRRPQQPAAWLDHNFTPAVETITIDKWDIPAPFMARQRTRRPLAAWVDPYFVAAAPPGPGSRAQLITPIASPGRMMGR